MAPHTTNIDLFEVVSFLSVSASQASIGTTGYCSTGGAGRQEYCRELSVGHCHCSGFGRLSVKFDSTKDFLLQ